MDTKKIQDAPGNSGEHRNDYVEITINDKPYQIRRGRQSIEEIRRIGEVPSTHTVLEQLVEGKLIDVSNLDGITIKGGELFISHVPDGRSA